MGDPITAAFAIGTGAQVYGQYAGAQAAKEKAKFDAKILRNNQKIAKEQGKELVTQGFITAKQLENDAIRLADNQLLAFAGRGIDITSGAPQAVIEETARFTAADIVTLLHNVKRDVWAVEVGIAGLEAEEALARSRARRIGKAADIQLIAGVATGGARTAAFGASLPGG